MKNILKKKTQIEKEGIEEIYNEWHNKLIFLKIAKSYYRKKEYRMAADTMLEIFGVDKLNNLKSFFDDEKEKYGKKTLSYVVNSKIWLGEYEDRWYPRVNLFYEGENFKRASKTMLGYFRKHRLKLVTTAVKRIVIEAGYDLNELNQSIGNI